MFGNVKVFFEQKGYGFINSEDGLDYFFHVKDTNITVTPYVGMRVEFTVETREKGPVAKNVCNIELPQKKSFILIGETRIKISNIKMYEITDHHVYDSKTFGWKTQGKKLVITTFQGETFEFLENEFDIYAKCKELDDLLCN